MISSLSHKRPKHLLSLREFGRRVGMHHGMIQYHLAQGNIASEKYIVAFRGIPESEIEPFIKAREARLKRWREAREAFKASYKPTFERLGLLVPTEEPILPTDEDVAEWLADRLLFEEGSTQPKNIG